MQSCQDYANARAGEQVEKTAEISISAQSEHERGRSQDGLSLNDSSGGFRDEIWCQSGGEIWEAALRAEYQEEMSFDGHGAEAGMR